MANTGLPFTVRTVRVMQVAYDESGDHLGLFRGRDDGSMEEVHATRDMFAADICVLIVSQGGCGLAYIAPGNEADGFQLVTLGCLDLEAFRHELGHNLGSKHWASEAGSYFPYSSGHVLVSGGVAPPGTAMGGNHLPQYSNPRLSVNGIPTGVHLGSPDAADNYLAFLQTAPILANFRCSGDCDGDGMFDATVIAAGIEEDCDENGVPDSCQRDINANGIVDACEPLPVIIRVPGDVASIQEAMALAEGGVHEVVVDPGIYAGPVDMLGKAVTLRSSGGPQSTVVTGSGLTRAFLIRTGETANTVIEGFTIADGFTNGDGGGMLIERASPVIRDCIFRGSTAGYAGGHLRVTAGSPLVENCSFDSGNAAYGGAVSLWSGSPDFISCVFRDNESNASGRGGAISNWTSASLFASCSFIDNDATGEGGAIFVVDGGVGARLRVQSSLFCGNTPDHVGPGIWTDGGGNDFSSECMACLPDTNNDGLLTPADFNAWIIAFNNNAPECDQNNDGLCNPADFNAWILNYTAGCG